MRWLAGKYPRLTATAFGIAVAGAILLLAEGVCFVLNQRADRWRFESTKLLTRHERLGYVPVPNRQTRVVKCSNATVAFDCVYTIDEHSRRVVPVSHAERRDRFLLFFGGSCTFGEGLNDDETFPYFVSRAAPRYTPHVFAVPGYGPAHMLEQLEDPSIRDEVREPAGIALYTFIGGHVDRVIGRMRIVSVYGRHHPYYTLDNRRLVRKGSFTTGRPLTTGWYRLLGKSQTITYLNLDFPRQVTDDHLALLARIVEESANVFDVKFPNSRFYVLLFPGMGREQAIKPLIEAKGIRCLHYPGCFPGPREQYQLPDGHPNRRATELLARRLVQDLGIGGSLPSEGESPGIETGSQANANAGPAVSRASP